MFDDSVARRDWGWKHEKGVEELAGMNCLKIVLPGKSILGDYFQENGTSRIPFLLLRISFPGRPIFIQLPPDIMIDGLRPVYAKERERQEREAKKAN